MEVCLKLAELGADLNKADGVSETFCNCMSVCCCIIVMPLAFKPNLQKRPSFTLQRGDNALHLACRAKNLAVARWLVEQMSREAALALNQVRGSFGCDSWWSR